MRSRLLHSGYMSGISLIVGERKGGGVEVDGVILHTAYCLSDTVFLIEDGKIGDGTATIYLCGHGDLARRSIGGRSMREIADLLIAAGYRGRQPVYLAACSANEPYRGKTMVGLLEEELGRRLPRVGSDVTGPSVTLKNGRGTTETWLLDCDWLELSGLREFQNRFLADGYVFRVKNSSQLPLDYKRCREPIAAYKQDLILGKIGRRFFSAAKRKH